MSTSSDRKKNSRVHLYGDPVFAMRYLKHASSSHSKERWVALDIMQFRPDPRDDLWPCIEYDAKIERDEKGVSRVIVGEHRYVIVR